MTMNLNTEADAIVDDVPWNKILEKSSVSGSGDKNVLFTFLLETMLLKNGSFWNFAHEDIIDHQIISNGKKTHIC